MKLILISVAIIIAIPSFILGQATSQSLSCEQTAKELESKITKITQDLDKPAFEEFVSDDVIIIRADGETTSKKEQSASFNLPPNLVFSFTSENIKVRACGESSIITTGKDIIKATEKKSKKTAIQDYWFTRIYEKRQGRWQLIYNQLTSTNE
jgi:competence protein ComGC